jgi:hypothetical protein
MLSAIPLDVRVADEVHRRFGAVTTMIALRSHIQAERRNIDARRQRLLVIR